MRHPAAMAGFSMMEVLVTVVVLSIGLLGLAGLQSTALRNNHSAYHRSQAAILAEDMADRIRANLSGFTSGYYDGTAAENTSCLSTAGCSSQAMARHDTWEWQQNLADTLPNGQGTVATNGDRATITVMWDDARTGATGTGCNPNNANDMLCYQLIVEP